MSRIDDVRDQYKDTPAYNMIGGVQKDIKNLLVELLCENISVNENISGLREELKEAALKQQEIHVTASDPGSAVKAVKDSIARQKVTV